MDFKFNITAKASDFFKMSMKKIYKTPIGIFNIIVSVSALVATIRVYGTSSTIMRGILVMLCILFPLVQPFSIYMRSLALVKMLPKGLTIETKANGLWVTTPDRSELVSYDRIKSINDAGDCLIVSLGGRHGYVLFNRIMEGRKEEFAAFLRSRVK